MCTDRRIYDQDDADDSRPANYDIDPTHFDGEDPSLNENNPDIGMED